MRSVRRGLERSYCACWRNSGGEWVGGVLGVFLVPWRGGGREEGGREGGGDGGKERGGGGGLVERESGQGEDEEGAALGVERALYALRFSDFFSYDLAATWFGGGR